MKILVCGGRNYTDAEALTRILDEFHKQIPITKLIHGAARGADTLADSWAKTRNIPTTRYVAKWNKYGRSAGYKRNKQMLDHGKPDLVIAFPGGPGTNDMMAQARLAQIRLIIVKHED